MKKIVNLLLLATAALFNASLPAANIPPGSYQGGSNTNTNNYYEDTRFYQNQGKTVQNPTAPGLPHPDPAIQEKQSLVNPGSTPSGSPPIIRDRLRSSPLEFERPASSLMQEELPLPREDVSE